MVIQSDAVVDPGAVVVKHSHTGVAGGTVLGTQGEEREGEERYRRRGRSYDLNHEPEYT